MAFKDIFTQQGNAAAPVSPGVFCDVYGTLINSSLEPDRDLVAYLNALHESGVRVTIFSTDHFGMRPKTRQIGLHPELAGAVVNKSHFSQVVLETLIDDEPPGYLKAAAQWHPKSPEFRVFLKSELARLASGGPGPAHPAP